MFFSIYNDSSALTHYVLLLVNYCATVNIFLVSSAPLFSFPFLNSQLHASSEIKSCGREFHLKCCSPPLTTVPQGAFYCVDCSEKGSTALLEQYLDEHEDRKAFRIEEASVSSSLKKSSKTTKQSSQQLVELGGDQQFIDQLLLDDLNDTNTVVVEEPNGAGRDRHEDDATNSTSSRAPKGGTIAKSSQKPRLAAIPQVPPQRLPLSELWMLHGEEDRAARFCGLALKLYCPLGNHYHTGRILDARPPRKTLVSATTAATPITTTSDPSREKVSPAFAHVADTECLVRFPAGIDHRKTSLVRWIRLEEHCIAVATQIVWGKFAKGTVLSSPSEIFPDTSSTTSTTGDSPKKKKSRKRKSSPSTTTTTTPTWLPGRVWSRTSRELVPVVSLLDESKGQIQFRWSLGSNSEDGISTNNTKSTGSRSRSQTPNQKRRSETRKDSVSDADAAAKQSIRSSQKSPPWGLVETFGGETYELLEMEHSILTEIPPCRRAIVTFSDNGESTDQESGLSMEQKKQFQILVSMARCESYEQDRVRHWRSLTLLNPVHPLALTSRDEEALGPLDFFLPGPSSAGVEATESHGILAGHDPEASLNNDTVVKTATLTEDISGEETDDNFEHIELCPLIRQGLDRAYILELMSRQLGITPSRDMASSLVCEMVDSISDVARGITLQHREI
jgi:hypothetical protein